MTHLKARTTAKPQLKDARCPFGNKYGIEPPCVDDDPANRLAPSLGADSISHWQWEYPSGSTRFNDIW